VKAKLFPNWLPIEKPKTLELGFKIGDEEVGHDLYLLLGGNSSGVGFHSHAESLVALLWGRKRWVLYPPGTVPVPKTHHVSGLRGQIETDDLLGSQRSATAAARPVECWQNAGELLYVPEGWHHATLNYGETIGIALQARVAASEFMQSMTVALSMQKQISSSPPQAIDVQFAREAVTFHELLVKRHDAKKIEHGGGGQKTKEELLLARQQLDYEAGQAHKALGLMLLEMMAKFPATTDEEARSK
jgi:hypothetical protein